MSCACESKVRELEKKVAELEARVDMREERWLEMAELCQRTGKSRSWFYNGHAEKCGLQLFRGKGGIRCLESEFRRWLKDPRPAAA